MRTALMVDRLHARAIQSVVLQKFADVTRVVLAVGFFAPGLHKLIGKPFTTRPYGSPMEAFFNGLYQTGFYYRFIGAAQVLAALLVLFHPTATLGALLFFSITLNVFVVTISIPFGTGTPIITGLMLLGSIYLVCWDYDKLRPLVPFLGTATDNHRKPLVRVENSSSVVGRIGYWAFAISGILLMCELRGLFPNDLKIRRAALLATVFGGLIMTSGFVIDIVRSLRSPFAKRDSLAR